MKELNSKIACGIRQLRVQKGLSQEALAERCSLDRTYISGIERCTRNVTIDSLEKIIVLGLQVPTSEFFTFIEGCDD